MLFSNYQMQIDCWLLLGQYTYFIFYILEFCLAWICSACVFDHNVCKFIHASVLWQKCFLEDFHDKNLGKIRNSRSIPKHDRSSLKQTSSQHQTKWWEAGSNHTKIRDSLPIQHCTWSPSQINSTTKGDQGDTNWKGRSQDITICRWYDSIYKWLQKFYQRTPTDESG